MVMWLLGVCRVRGVVGRVGCSCGIGNTVFGEGQGIHREINV